MSAQFFKRKAKELAKKEVEAPIASSEKPSVSSDLSEESYDVVFDSANNMYKIITIKYNLDTMEAKVVSSHKLERGLALTFENRKKALKELIKRKYKGEVKNEE